MSAMISDLRIFASPFKNSCAKTAITLAVASATEVLDRLCRRLLIPRIIPDTAAHERAYRRLAFAGLTADASPQPRGSPSET